MAKQERNILEYLKIKVRVEHRPDNHIRDFLSGYTLGSPGRLRYRLKSVQDKIRRLPDCSYITLRVRERFMGVVGLAYRVTLAGDTPYDSWYVRYFHIRAPLRTKKRKKQDKRADSNGSSMNMIKEAVMEYFNHPHLMKEHGCAGTNMPSLIYAAVEKNNRPSQEFSDRMGIESVSEFCTLIFSRFFPRKHEGFGRLPEQGQKEMKARLRSFYRQHVLYSETNLFARGSYFIYRENGRILSGVQVCPESWEIIEMPGPAGFLFRKIVPRIPRLRKILNLNDFRFLSLEAVYYEKDAGESLIPLFESVLKHYGFHLAMIWLDMKSPVLKILEKQKKMGFVHRAMKPVKAEIRVKFNDVPEDEKKIFSESPVYLSGYDMT